MSIKYRNSAWTELRKLKLDRDIENCVSNLERIFKKKKLTPSTDIVWFRLCHAGGPRADIEVVGYKGLVNDESWASKENLTYFPKECLLQSDILSEIYNIAYFRRNPLERILESTLSISYAAFIAHTALNELPMHFIRGNPREIFVGWDSTEGYCVSAVIQPVIRKPKL
jgi:hypothetical protein